MNEKLIRMQNEWFGIHITACGADMAGRRLSGTSPVRAHYI
jgi:hypothetical protein